MSYTKRVDRWGLLGAIETTYGTLVTLSDATHGIHVVEDPIVTPTFLHDGKRRAERSAAAGRTLPMVAKSGRSNAFDGVMEARGPDAAYAVGTAVPDHDIFMRICGLQQVVNPGVDCVYSPRMTGFESGSFRNYTGQEQHESRGCYGTVVITSDGPEVPVHTFSVQGVGNQPTDVVLPAVTYPDLTLQPAKASAITFVIGSYNAVKIRSFTFTQNAVITPRADLNGTIAGGHAGFGFMHGDATLEVQIEAAAFVGTPFHAAGGMNPYQLQELATQLAIVLGPIGGVANNRFTLNLLTAQLDDVSRDGDGGGALWTLTFAVPVADPGSTADWNETWT